MQPFATLLFAFISLSAFTIANHHTGKHKLSYATHALKARGRVAYKIQRQVTLPVMNLYYGGRNPDLSVKCRKGPGNGEKCERRSMCSGEGLLITPWKYCANQCECKLTTPQPSLSGREGSPGETRTLAHEGNHGRISSGDVRRISSGDMHRTSHRGKARIAPGGAGHTSSGDEDIPDISELEHMADISSGAKHGTSSGTHHGASSSGQNQGASSDASPGHPVVHEPTSMEDDWSEVDSMSSRHASVAGSDWSDIGKPENYRDMN